MTADVLSPAMRFYIYALHGCAIEVLWTAVWDVFYFKSKKTNGSTSLWALLIYGLSILSIEMAHLRLKAVGVPLFFRALIYTVWSFVWEFSTGYVLKIFDACPWDYSPWFHYNVMGLITFEYAPLWFFGCIVVEKVLIKSTLELSWSNGRYAWLQLGLCGKSSPWTEKAERQGDNEPKTMLGSDKGD
eukprot:GHVN01033977.1.p1 GENE.GHVN01033977.1~~GHVN01033977.1.p1  ORF type:complete len:187 (+),score=16.49 GHVN01033977.1:508-1068(+)